MIDTAAPAPPLLPTQAVSQFAAAVNANEILIALGSTRISMVETDGLPVPRAVIEWFVTLATSPQAARTLTAILGHALEQYEAQFGPIPADPAFKVETGT